MPRPTKMSDDDVKAKLPAGWIYDGGALKRTIKFGDFQQAFAFMTRVALWAEKRDHHPDWRNVYNTVELTLSTHDAGGVTTLDFELAAAVDAAAR